jgi:hypothetical protein
MIFAWLAGGKSQSLLDSCFGLRLAILHENVPFVLVQGSAIAVSEKWP